MTKQELTGWDVSETEPSGRIADPDESDDRLEADGASAAEPREPDPGEPSEAREPPVGGDRIRLGMESGNVDRSFIHNIGKLTLNEKHYQQVVADPGRSATLPERSLGRNDFEIWSTGRIGDLERSLILDEDAVAQVTSCLELHGIAVLVGDAGLGKGSLAQGAATRLLARETLQELLHTTALERNVRVEADELLDPEGAFTRCVLLLEDFHDDENPDLGRWIRRLNEPTLRTLTERLRAAGSYLLLTSEPENLPVRLERLKSLGVTVEVEAPSEEALLQSLHQRAAQKRVDHDREDPDLPEKVATVLTEHGQWLAARLGTVPRAVRFMDESVVRVARGELDLERAVERLDDLEHWLLEELPEDPTLWSFTVAMILASAHPRERWVPWSALHALWREVEDVLEAELVRGEDERSRPVGRLIVDDRFLARARATVRRLPYPLGESIRLRDPNGAERLWRVLLGPGRALVTTLLPRMDRLARSEDPVLQQIALRCLGRMGELEPRAIALPQLGRWERSGSAEHSFALGRMVVGALASEDGEYVEGCLDRLRRAVGDVGSENGPNRRLVALVPVGGVALQWVLETLGKLLERRLGRLEEGDAPSLSRRIHRFVEQESEAGEGLDDLPRELVGEVPLALLARDDVRALVSLDGTQFVLVGLCFNGDVIPVFDRLGRWLKDDDVHVAPWLALLNLRRRGLLTILEEHPVRPLPRHEDSGDTGQLERFSRILLAVDHEGSVRILARFLEGSFAACEPFPARLRMNLRRRLVELLKDWVRTAAPVEWLRPRVVDLLRELVDSEDEVLQREIFALLRRDPDMTREGTPEEALALDVLRGSVPGAGAPPTSR